MIWAAACTARTILSWEREFSRSKHCPSEPELHQQYANAHPRLTHRHCRLDRAASLGDLQPALALKGESWQGCLPGTGEEGCLPGAPAASAVAVMCTADTVTLQA